LIGSQLVPYIYEDFFTHEQLRDAFIKVYNFTPEEKLTLKAQMIDYVDHEFNFEKVIADWDATLSSTIEKFRHNSKEQVGIWTLQSIDTPVRRVEQPPAALNENQKLQEEVMKKMSELKKTMNVKKRQKKESVLTNDK